METDVLRWRSFKHRRRKRGGINWIVFFLLNITLPMFDIDHIDFALTYYRVVDIVVDLDFVTVMVTSSA